MRRTRVSIVLVLGGATLFLGGCLVGAAAHQYMVVSKVAQPPADQVAAAPVEEPVLAQPLVHRPVKTIVVRADGSFAEPVNN